VTKEENQEVICEKCKGEMNFSIKGSEQGWSCPVCGWGIVTTYIDEIDADMTEYSLCIRNVQEIDKEKIEFIAKIANVNFIIARQMLQEKEVCILKAKALEIKAAIVKLQELNIDYNVSPMFKY